MESHTRRLGVMVRKAFAPFPNKKKKKRSGRYHPGENRENTKIPISQTWEVLMG